VSEYIHVLIGELALRWVDVVGGQQEHLLRPGEVAFVETDVHTLSNDSDSSVRFLVVKAALTSSDESALFQTDRVPVGSEKRE